MIGQIVSARVWFMSAVLGAAIFAAPAVSAATIQVINNDGAGEGFNDPTARSPVGGNSGTTLGAQRLIAFQAAANLWGAKLTSNVTIKVRAQFDPQTCNSTSTILGSAGPVGVNRNFANAPVVNTWYPAALADSLAGTDLSAGANPDINATFNSAIGTTCAFPNVWYYGLDGNPPGSQIDFVSVLIHELGHGLGFLTFSDLTSGAKLSGVNDVFMLNLESHGASPADYPSMTDAQRVTASKATGSLHWIGSNVRTAGSVLTAGRVGDHVQMYAPATQEPGSSVSHWDTALTPNQVMEPSYTQPLHTFALELAAFKDIGWNVSDGGTRGVAVHDFNGDGKSDIVWRNTAGDNALWFMNGGSVSSVAGVLNVPTNWSIVGQRDFDGDGKTDLLWASSSGEVAIWLMNGGSILSATSLGNIGANWSVVGTADFNGDGKGDILWRSTTGDTAVWFMNGLSVLSAAGLGNGPLNWSIAATPDFNGDGKSDILWRNTAGDHVIWLMNGASVSSVAMLGNVTTNWSAVGTADFNGDGKGDIVWRSSTGDLAIWLMNGGTLSSVTPLGNVSTDWSIVSNGDYNGDGKGDVLWRNTAGINAIWFMNGTSVSSVADLGNVPTNWTIQNMNAN